MILERIIISAVVTCVVMLVNITLSIWPFGWTGILLAEFGVFEAILLVINVLIAVIVVGGIPWAFTVERKLTQLTTTFERYADMQRQQATTLEHVHSLERKLIRLTALVQRKFDSRAADGDTDLEDDTM